MSSDIKEISKLKELLCRKKVSKIKSKYYKAEKKIYKNNWNIDDVLHSSNADGVFGGGNGKLQYVKTGRLF